ncbi:MAG: hypothetical protein ACE5G5_08935 [Candidatus Methylomirabilales bacterium]
MLVSVSQREREGIFEYWGGRFGVPPSALSGLRFLIRGRNVWAVSEVAGLEKTLTPLKVEAAGLPFLRRRGRLWKPTTAALLYLGNLVSKNVVDLSPELLNPFLRGEVLPGPFPAEGGYVAARHEGKMLGCALYGKAGLKSQLPRAWVQALLSGSLEIPEEQ